MNRVLLIDADRAASEAFVLGCLGRDVAVQTVETLCDGVRYALEAPVSAILVDAGLIRLAREQTRSESPVAASSTAAPLVASPAELAPELVRAILASRPRKEPAP